MTTVEFEKLKSMEYLDINWNLYQEEEKEILLRIAKVIKNISLLENLLNQ